MSTAELLAGQIERLLANEVSQKSVAAAEHGEWPTALWTRIESMGLTVALVPEATGGAGLSWSDAGVIFTALGAHSAPVPLGETMIAAWALASSGQAVPAGPLTLAPTGFSVVRRRVTGTVDGVPWAAEAGHMVMADGDEIHLIRLADTRIASNRSIARDPRARVSCEATTPLASGRLPHPAAAMQLEALGATLRAAQMAGAMRRVLALCVDYANIRNQFGRPIAKFQAVQHMIAVIASETAAAEAAAALGLRAADASAFDVAPGAAKVRAAMAASRVAALAHAVHGAIGVTDEYALHYLTRRLWQWRDEFGSERTWAERMGQTALAAGSTGLWDLVVTAGQLLRRQ